MTLQPASNWVIVCANSDWVSADATTTARQAVLNGFRVNLIFVS
jgi:hypothetical protein